MYPAIPFEMMRTVHDEPQLSVTVDGMEAICVGLRCGYAYEEPPGLITGFTVDGLNVTITGENLPLDLIGVRLSQTNCLIYVGLHDSSKIECRM